MNWFTEPWAFPFMRWALLACLVLAGMHAYLGYHIVRRGVLFVDLAMAQAAALGAAVGVVVGLEHDTLPEFFLSAAFAVGSGVFFALAKSKKVHQESIVAAFYALAAAATFVVLERSPHGMEEVKHLFVGQILTVPADRVLTTLGIYAVFGLAHDFMHSRTLAVTEGRSKSKAVEFFFFGTFALVVTISVGLAGVLLVFAFLVLPTMASIFLSPDGKGRLTWGWAMGALASVLGLHLAFHWDMPAAPMVVLTLGAVLLASAAAGKLR